MRNLFLLIPGMLMGLVFYAVGFTIFYFVVKHAIISAHREINRGQ